MKNRTLRFVNHRLLTADSSSRIALLALAAFIVLPNHFARAQGKENKPVVIPSYHNDVSPALRDVEPWPTQRVQEHEAAENPLIITEHVDRPDPVVQKSALLAELAPSIPAPILNFNGIPFPGVTCNCAPPDTNGEVGATQYVQIVNEGFQVFDKTTGASVLGPVSITPSGPASAASARPAATATRSCSTTRSRTAG